MRALLAPTGGKEKRLRRVSRRMVKEARGRKRDKAQKPEKKKREDLSRTGGNVEPPLLGRKEVRGVEKFLLPISRGSECKKGPR